MGYVVLKDGRIRKNWELNGMLLRLEQNGACNVYLPYLEVNRQTPVSHEGIEAAVVAKPCDTCF